MFTDQHRLHEVCDSGTLAGSALPSCQALPCNFSWPGPKVCFGWTSWEGWLVGVLVVGGGYQPGTPFWWVWVGWVPIDSSFVWGAAIQQFFGAKLEHQNPHMSRCFVLFFCGETAEKLLWSKEARAASGMMGLLESTQKNLQRVLSFAEMPKQCQVEVWMKSRKFSFPNAGWVSSVRWIRRFMVNLLRCLDFSSSYDPTETQEGFRKAMHWTIPELLVPR